jgi:porin
LLDCIFESRPADALGLGVVRGRFSEDLQDAQQVEELINSAIGVQSFETAIELTYRLYFNNNAVFLQPDVQYMIRPNGTGLIRNALVAGLQFGVNF